MPVASPVTSEVRKARVAVALTFLMHAATFSTWAPRIPSIKENLDLSHDDLGFALGGMAVGLLIGTRLTGRMEKQGRTGTAMRVVIALQAIALVGPGFAVNLWTLTAALFVLGLLGGMLDVLMNAHAVAVERLYERPIMSAFHGLWSVGSMVGSAIAAGVAQLGVDVRLHFIVVAAILLIASVPLLSPLLSGDHEAATTGHHVDEARPKGPPVGLLVVTVLCVMGFGSFLAEGSVADWGPLYMHENVGTSEAFAALSLSVFSGAMAICRLIADRVGMVLGPVMVARIGTLISLVGFLLFLFVQQPAVALIGFALAGFGIGPVVPIVFSAGGNTRTKKRASVLGPTVSAGYVGAVVGPVAIGAIAERAGLNWALGVPVLFLVVILLSAGLLAGASGGTDEETKSHAHGPPHADG